MARIIAAALLALALAPTAQAQTSADRFTQDTRCAVVGLSMAGAPSATPEQQQSGTMLAIHFIGRMYGASPGINLEETLFAQAEIMGPAELQSEGVRCGLELRDVGQLLIDIGNRRMGQGTN